MIDLKVKQASKDSAWIYLPTGEGLATVNNLAHVECVKKALEEYINTEAAVANRTTE